MAICSTSPRYLSIPLWRQLKTYLAKGGSPKINRTVTVTVLLWPLPIHSTLSAQPSSGPTHLQSDCSMLFPEVVPDNHEHTKKQGINILILSRTRSDHFGTGTKQVNPQENLQKQHKPSIHSFHQESVYATSCETYAKP
jgi:hypothetical protein